MIDKKVVVTVIWEKNGYVLRASCREDAERYYSENFNPLHPETARLTGSRQDFGREEVIAFFLRCLEEENRYDFLLIAPDGRIIGETVLNEWNKETASANFRVAIFNPADWNKGLGSWAVRETVAFAFGKTPLRRLELGVYACNPRALHVYEKLGFQRTQIIPAMAAGSADEIIMELTKSQWEKQNKGE